MSEVQNVSSVIDSEQLYCTSGFIVMGALNMSHTVLVRVVRLDCPKNSSRAYIF